ncbi:hypothetical protein ACLD43_16720 [Clostridium botulinum]|uniref:hypothetical protein n=1 Tax=Clostridium botulinum TaxID=1491 RepID=UPI003A7F8096
MNKTKKTLIGTILIIILITLGYKYYNFSQYKKAINSAETAMDNLEYDNAISLFNESLKYKKSDSVNNKIKRAKELQVDKQSYNKGINLMKNKQYNEAINSFKIISKKSKALYSMAQDKIKESTNILTNEKIKLIKENIKNKKYEEVNKSLDEILKIDSSNKDAKNLKKLLQ